MRKFVYIVCFTLLVFSCKKERPQPQVPTAIPLQKSADVKVFVVNQGVWPNNNSSISLYSEELGLVSSNYFTIKNSNAVLGSVPQSMIRVGDYYYVAVNSAAKVLILDSNFVFVREINNLNSPRFLQNINNSKVYVSDLYADKISIINTNTQSIVGSIPVRGWSEQMQQIDSRVYVCDYDSSKLYVIDTSNDAITDSMSIGKGAEYMVQDANKHLWVLCTSIYNNEHKYLKCIDVATKTILKSFEFPVNEFPTGLQINAEGKQLYFINKHVYSMSIDASSLPTEKLIAGDAPKNFYALGIHPTNEHVYVSDSKYGQAFDRVYVYSKTGEAISNFESGYITGYFYFDRQ